MTSLTHHSLTERVGGPVGHHAERRGWWFDPGPFIGVAATLMWVVLMLRQAPCRVKAPDDAVNAFLRLCYSDIPNYYRTNDVWQGKLPFLDFSYAQPFLSGVFATVTRGLAQVFGAGVSPRLSAQRQLDGAWSFTAAAGVLLFVCFLALVTAHMLMGVGSQSRTQAGRRVRTWDGLMIAASPVVLASGMVGWDLFGVALVSCGLLAWARRRTVLAGLLLGLGAASLLQLSVLYPLPVLLTIGVLAWRAAKLQHFVITALTAMITWGVLTLVAALINPEAVHGSLNPTSRLGSISYMVGQLGLKIDHVSAIGVVLTLLCWAGIGWFALAAPRRPRVGQVAYLMTAAALIVGTQYAPQQSLWLLPLVVLARPRIVDQAIFAFGEVIYWLAIWLHLNGTLAAGQSSIVMYWAAIIFRIGCQVVIAARVVHDIRRPWDDPVREPLIDDPIGGPLDHAPDVVTAAALTARIAPPVDEVADGGQYEPPTRGTDS